MEDDRTDGGESMGVATSTGSRGCDQTEHDIVASPSDGIIGDHWRTDQGMPPLDDGRVCAAVQGSNIRVVSLVIHPVDNQGDSGHQSTRQDMCPKEMSLEAQGALDKVQP